MTAFFIGLTVLYLLFVVIAAGNWLLMRRPPKDGEEVPIAIAIPARNEAENLALLLPMLDPAQHRVYVFDDESDDGTADVARAHGARVISPREPLPQGWTGKNRACHELALAIAEDFDGDWILFLDADTRPSPEFVRAMQRVAASTGRRRSVVTGFPEMIPGDDPAERIYLFWVPWLLLATNPFGLVARSGLGHNGFTNGQVVLWRSSTYLELRPHEALRGAILEDVRIGRMLAREKVAVAVMNLSDVLAVKMYNTCDEARAGMTKNAYEIVGSAAGTKVVGTLMMTLGMLAGPLSLLLMPSAGLWVFGPLLLLPLSGLIVDQIVRRGFTAWSLLWVSLYQGGYTFIQSAEARRQGAVTWKGRNYPS